MPRIKTIAIVVVIILTVSKNHNSRNCNIRTASRNKLKKPTNMSDTRQFTRYGSKAKLPEFKICSALAGAIWMPQSHEQISKACISQPEPSWVIIIIAVITVVLIIIIKHINVVVVVVVVVV